MRKCILIFLLAATAGFMTAGCGKVDGPRFWWDDRNQERLEEYALPSDPGAPIDAGIERKATASGEDLSEDNLRDYRTNLDQEEEKRKSDASLLDF